MQQLLKAPHYASASIKDVDTKQGIVSGYFANFNTLDHDNDIIEPGAFTKTISERGPKSAKPRIKYLLDHDTSKALGVIINLEEDANGLRYEAQSGSHILGKDFVNMVDSGIITEHSFGYGVVQKSVENPDADWKERRTRLKELCMWEGSPLQTWGANENTPLVGMKARIKAFYRIEVLIKAIGHGKYSDERFLEFQKELILLQQAIKNSDYESTEPDVTDESTQPNDEEKNLLNEVKLLRSRLSLTI